MRAAWRSKHVRNEHLSWASFFLGVLTGAYTIYGGLKSAAWTDFMQIGVLLAGGILVPILGLQKVGGIAPALMHDVPAEISSSSTAAAIELFPFTGVFTSFLSVGIWYNCTSQHIVQRCLAREGRVERAHGRGGRGLPARSSRRSLRAARASSPIKLFPHLERPDSAYLMLVQTLIPSGLRGLILAAMAAALMSHLSSMINSTSTILTMDLYKRAVKPDADQHEMVRFGQWSGFAVLAGQYARRALLREPAKALAVRADPGRFRLYCAAVRGDLHRRDSVAARERRKPR